MGRKKRSRSARPKLTPSRKIPDSSVTVETADLDEQVASPPTLVMEGTDDSKSPPTADVNESYDQDAISFQEAASEIAGDDEFNESQVASSFGSETLNDQPPNAPEMEGALTPTAAISVSPPEQQGPVLRAIEDNTRLLEGLIRNLEMIRPAQDHQYPQHQTIPGTSQTQSDVDSQIVELERANSELVDTNEQLERTLSRLQLRIDELETSGDSVNSTDSASTTSSSQLSWEEQKQAILSQMEADEFDAENFIETLSSDAETHWPGEVTDNPTESVQRLFATVDELRSDLEAANDELTQLRRTLSDRNRDTINVENATATGATAIADLLGQDDLVVEERQRLKDLKAEWEGKFRKIEVETSLERAKLSRERQELAEKLANVESELIQTKRENQTAEETGHAKRRWLAKLGLERG